MEVSHIEGTKMAHAALKYANDAVLSKKKSSPSATTAMIWK